MDEKLKTFFVALAGGAAGAITVFIILFGIVGLGQSAGDKSVEENKVKNTVTEKNMTKAEVQGQTSTAADNGTQKPDNTKNIIAEAGKENVTMNSGAEAGKENVTMNSGTEAVKENIIMNSGTEAVKETGTTKSGAEAGKETVEMSGNKDKGVVSGNTNNAAGEIKAEKGTPFVNHGKLAVKGTNLVDKNGKKYQLKGVSTHGIAWYPDYVSYNAFKTLRDDWGANLVRLAMYTAESGGYCTGGDREKLEKLIDTGVKAASELGMYVVIDWHILSDGNPNTYKAEAKNFFKKMTNKYKNYDNVLYEICNEPNGGVSWNDVKAYADEIIPIIRANDKDAIIIVGTPTWSQDVEQVAANPLEKQNQRNVMYAAHFYAATHGDNIREKIKTAIGAGTPVFISEFSICDASGNGGIDYDSAEKWYQLISSHNISYAGWSLANKAETSAIIKPDCTKTFGWKKSELSDTGVWLRNKIKGITLSEDGATKNNVNDGQSGSEKESTLQAEGIYQFDVTIKNISASDIPDWKVTYKLPEGCSVVNGWCCDYKIEGKVLTVKALDWNKTIQRGQSLSGLGIQISSKKKLSDFTVKNGKYEAEFKMANSW